MGERSFNANAKQNKVGSQKRVDNTQLLAFLTSNPPPSPAAAAKALTNYTKMNRKAVPLDLSMIPFRRAAYNCDFEAALTLMDVVSGHESRVAQLVNRRLMRFALIWLAASGGVLYGVDYLLKSGIIGMWDNPGPIVLMVATYLTAVSAYGIMAFSSIKAGSGIYLQWAQGTSFLYRMQYARRLKMADLLVASNRMMPENDGECAPRLLSELQQRNLVPIQTEEEGMLKEYWARGGEGFEWVEPDQDPAEITWRTKLEHDRQSRIGSPYVHKGATNKNWEETLKAAAENRFIPHASLIDMKELRTPEKMAALEEELRTLKIKKDKLANSEPDITELLGGRKSVPKLGDAKNQRDDPNK